MVCPMRFVLVGISVCLAWIAAWRMYSDQQQQHEEQEHAAGSSKRGSSTQPLGHLSKELLSWSTLLDMFTGKYIYNYCKGTHVVKAS